MRDARRAPAERREILDWLALGGHTTRDVDLFAVVSGPGSFTGLRVGIAAIQGFALAGDRPVVSVPTLDAMIATWLPSLQRRARSSPRGSTASGARCSWRRSTRPAGPRSTRAHRVLEPRAGRPEELGRPSGQPLRGPHLVVVCDDRLRWTDVLRRAASGRRDRGSADLARRVGGTPRRLAPRARAVTARAQADLRAHDRTSCSRANGPPRARRRRPATPSGGPAVPKTSPPWRRCSARPSRIPGAPRPFDGSSRTRTSHVST